MTSTPTSSDRKRIVIVDDEEALVWSLSNRITKLRPSYAVETAGDGHVALRRLEEEPADLLVTDIRMPAMSGLELIMAARRLYPNLPVVVMTAYPTAAIREEVTTRGSIDYLEKPFEFERFLAVVDEILERRQTGFSGAISVQTLPDIVQLYALSNTTGLLRVRHQATEGQVWFDRGSICHASTPNAEGVEAFYEIMLWSGGDFSMALSSTPPEHTIHASWTELIMESCRRIDDHRRGREEGVGPLSKQGWDLDPEPPGGDLFLADIPPIPHVEKVSVDILVEYPDPNVVQEKTMADIKDSLKRLDGIDGFVGGAIVDSESGMMLGAEGGAGINLEVAAASNTEVVRSKRKAMRNLNLKDEIEDILITLGKQYHLIRPLRAKPGIFFYVVLDRARSNLAMARLTLADVERELHV